MEKDLGVPFDRPHVDTQVAKANRIVGLLCISFVHRDKDTFTTLFKVMVFPHLEYGNTIWAPSLQEVKELIESMKRRDTIPT